MTENLLLKERDLFGHGMLLADMLTMAKEKYAANLPASMSPSPPQMVVVPHALINPSLAMAYATLSTLRYLPAGAKVALICPDHFGAIQGEEEALVISPWRRSWEWNQDPPEEVAPFLREHSFTRTLLLLIFLQQAGVLPGFATWHITVVLVREPAAQSTLLPPDLDCLVVTTDLTHANGGDYQLTDQPFIEAVLGCQLEATQAALRAFPQGSPCGRAGVLLGLRWLLLQLNNTANLPQGRLLGYGSSAGRQAVQDEVCLPLPLGTYTVSYFACIMLTQAQISSLPLCHTLSRFEEIQLLKLCEHVLLTGKGLELLPACWLLDSPSYHPQPEMTVFVTWRDVVRFTKDKGSPHPKEGRLRGCIGALPLASGLLHPGGGGGGDGGSSRSKSNLIQGVAEYALEAAKRDPRFNPIPANDLPLVRASISLLLGPPQATFSLAEFRRRFSLGSDAVYLKRGSASAIFLPQVPLEEGWDLDATLSALCQKAGLESTCYLGGGGNLQEVVELFIIRGCEFV